MDDNTKRPFINSGVLDFYLLYEHEQVPIINNLLQTCGMYRIPDDICSVDLAGLPSPVQSPDFVACFSSGVIPTTTSILGDTIIDVVRKESNPRNLEPDYNVYRHFLIKDSTGGIYISEPARPDHHWATKGQLKQIYSFVFEEEHYDSELFSWQFPIVKQFLYHYICYKVLHNRYMSSDVISEFWKYTIDAHIKMAFISWTKVFGSEGPNPTHWKNLSNGKAEELIQCFRRGLVHALGISEEEWHVYGKDVREFRDKYIAHTEPDFKEPVPYLDKAVKVAYFYDKWVRELILPDTMKEPPLEVFANRFREEVSEIANSLIVGKI